MIQQREILTATPVLTPDGQPNAGFCRRNLYQYNKNAIRTSRWRLKEWDFYQLSDGEYMVMLNFFNIAFCSVLSAEVCHLPSGKRWEDAVIEPLTPGKNPLSPAADEEDEFTYQRGGRSCRFALTDNEQTLEYMGKAAGKPLEISLRAALTPDQESLTTVTPFAQSGAFFYTQKLNCMPVAGMIRFGGQTHTFDPEKTYLVMDWGRGVWPWRNNWYWSNGSTRVNGKLFGFELTWGFGDDSTAPATALFYDGKCHKLGHVRLEHDPEQTGWLRPWHFMDDEGRLDLTMTPFLDHQTGLIFLNLLGMKSHQVHGLFSGHVILDDGTKLDIRNMYAFAEKVVNRW